MTGRHQAEHRCLFRVRAPHGPRHYSHPGSRCRPPDRLGFVNALLEQPSVPNRLVRERFFSSSSRAISASLATVRTTEGQRKNNSIPTKDIACRATLARNSVYLVWGAVTMWSSRTQRESQGRAARYAELQLAKQTIAREGTTR